MRTSVLPRRPFCITTLTAFSTVMIAGALQAEESKEKIRWNVLVLMADMLSPHYIACDPACTENILTPNLDRIGKEGMIFKKAYDAYPVCAPTRASLLTANYPYRHGQHKNNTPLLVAGPQGKTPSLAHLFRDNGYNTAMLGKQHSNIEPLEGLPNATLMGKNVFCGWDFRRVTGGDEGKVSDSGLKPTPEEVKVMNERADKLEAEQAALKDEYRKRYPEKNVGTPPPEWEKQLLKKYAKNGSPLNAKGMDHATGHTDGIIGFETLDYLDTYAGRRHDEKFGIDPKKPFFLFLSMQKPHHPWQAPLIQDGTEFWYMYSGRPEDNHLTYLHDGKPTPRRILNPIKNELLTEDPTSPHFGSSEPYKRPEAEDFARAKYSGCISWVDHMLGKVLDRLEVLDDPRNPGKKLKDTTIVCFTTDHGDMMGEKNRFSKMVMYEGSARVPFLIRMPGVIAPGQYSDVILNHVDMFPTLAGLAGLSEKVNPDMDGKDYSKAVLANDPTLGSQRSFTASSTVHGGYPGEIMSRTQRYKFMRYSRKERSNDNLPVMVLFDMEKDPYETVNVAYEPEYRDIVITESRACDEFMARYEPVKPVGLKAFMMEGKKKEPPVKSKKGSKKGETQED